MILAGMMVARSAARVVGGGSVGGDGDLGGKGGLGGGGLVGGRLVGGGVGGGGFVRGEREESSLSAAMEAVVEVSP